MFEIPSYIDHHMSENKIDQIDIQILRLLQGDARKSFKEIATQCGVSTDIIKNRFNTMEKKGIIRGTTIVIDPKQLEKKHLVFHWDTGNTSLFGSGSQHGKTNIWDVRSDTSNWTL
ncbi:MAG TPA: AsnC family transcriptional regulator [Candidatus Thermoplasmatota archaeon]|nr:AsnC family transcriptional regulator [Candidatus Thermoplasmatota archaeon]